MQFDANASSSVGTKTASNQAIGELWLLTDMLAQTSVEATSIATSAATVAGAGLGTPKVSREGARSPGGGAITRFGDQRGYGVLGGFGVVLAAVVFAFRGPAPVSTGGGSSLVETSVTKSTWVISILTKFS